MRVVVRPMPLHHKISWLFPDFCQKIIFPWPISKFPDFSLTLNKKPFSLTFPWPWEHCFLRKTDKLKMADTEPLPTLMFSCFSVKQRLNWTLFKTRSMCLDSINVCLISNNKCTKFHPNILNGFWVMARFWSYALCTSFLHNDTPTTQNLSQ